MPSYTITTDPSTNAATITCGPCGTVLFTRACTDDIEPRWGTDCPACGARHECHGQHDGDFAFDALQERVRVGFAKPEHAEAMDIERHIQDRYDAEGTLIVSPYERTV